MSDAGITMVRHDVARAFLERAEAWLLEREAEHNLFLSLAYTRARVDGDAHDALFGTVESGDAVVGCVIRTPPHMLMLTDMPVAAAGPVAGLAAGLYASLPAVLGPPDVAAAVAAEWVARRGGSHREAMRQRLYGLTEVMPGRNVDGRLRLVRADEADLVEEWGRGFAEELGPMFAMERRSIERWIDWGELFFWVDPEPMTMAVTQGRTPRGIRVGYVYTRPDARGHGYASACVAAVSQAMLDEGSSFCLLFTDLANPTSNAIYQRIGYEPLADVTRFDLLPEEVVPADQRLTGP